MRSTSIINGNRFEEIDGTLYLNGNEIVDEGARSVKDGQNVKILMVEESN